MQNRLGSFRKTLLPGSLIVLAFVIRLILFSLVSADYSIYFYPWYQTIQDFGPWKALGINFYNYTPSYIYLLDILILFHKISLLSAVKLISVIFDFSAAFAVYKIIKIRFPSGLLPWLGFYGAIFLPTAVVLSGYWGQCDSIYTSFILWSLFFILDDRYFLAVLFFSFAFTFKLQALLFAPVLLILFLHKKIPVYWFAAIPLVYCLSIIPACLAGRPFLDLLKIYFTQYDTYQIQAMNAANFYIFLNNLDSGFYRPIIWSGLIITAFFSLFYLLLRWKKWNTIEANAICFDAVFFSVILPFLLPKMHERYFYTGGFFLLILVFYHWDALLPAILIQISSLLSYIPFLSGGSVYLVWIGTLINLMVMILLYPLYVCSIKQPEIGKDALYLKKLANLNEVMF